MGELLGTDSRWDEQTAAEDRAVSADQRDGCGVMKCATYLAQSLPSPTGVQLVVFASCALTLLGAYLLILRITNERAKKLQNETGQPERRTVLPSPLLTKQVDDDYVTWSQLKPMMSKAEAELEKKLESHQRDVDKRFDKQDQYLSDKFHKLDDDLNGITVEAKNGREIATEQFQKIEGQLGELRSTSSHTNALAIRTDQAVREIPDKIAAA